MGSPTAMVMVSEYVSHVELRSQKKGGQVNPESERGMGPETPYSSMDVLLNVRSIYTIIFNIIIILYIII